MSEFRPIGDYGLLADCNGAALVDRSGSIDWLCLPRYDSPAVFARILDPRAGHWSIRPPEGFEVERRYIEGTLVLETTFRIASGVARMRDAMAFAPGQRGHDLGLDAPHEVLRLVECLSGRVELEMVYGELLESLLMYRERLGELDRSTQHFVADLADAAADSWERPDAGMWEMRGEPRHHLSSKLFCWVALDRAVTLAPSLGPDASPDRWAEEAERVRAAILERGWSERGQAYTQSFGSDELDASALLMPRFGFAAASDDPVRSTIERIASELTEDGLVLRYRTTEAPNPDGLPGEEATFVICSFWLVRCLVQLGELDRARTLLDRVLGYSNDLGLLAEQVDAASDELLGNFPQAFSHVGLIRASWDVDSAVGKSAAAR